MAAPPQSRRLGTLRRLARLVPFYRAYVGVEFTLLALVAAVVDTAAAGLAGSRLLVVALVAALAATAVGHLLSIVSSSRLR